MIRNNRDHRTKAELLEENEELHARLDEAEQTLDAIRSGDVDALVVAGPQGEQVFSLTGAERTYRLIVETMNEAALTVDLNGVILFCNQRFLELLQCPLSEAIGRELTAFVASAQKPPLQKFLANAQSGPVQRSLTLRAADGVAVSVQLAASPLLDAGNTSICLVASDLTELEAQADSIRVMHEHQQAVERSRAELQDSNAALSQSRLAALNVSEDAIAAREQAEELTAHLQREVRERQQAEQERRQSEERYHSLFDLMLEGFCIIEVQFDAEDRPIDYRFLEINPAFETQTGLHNVQGKLMRELAPENEAYWFEIYGSVALTGQSTRFVNEAQALNRWYDVSAYRIGGQDSRKVAILFNDVTDAKQAEKSLEKLNKELEIRVSERTQQLAALIEKLQLEIADREEAEKSVQRLNRLHAVLSQTNQAIVRTKDRDTLFNDFCRIAVQNGSFKLAWVGLVDEESGELNVVASAGATGYLKELRITVNEEPAGLGPTGISIRDGSYCICNDFLGSPITRPWHASGRAHGIRASASIALKQEERVVGALTLYADQKDFFDELQVELLQQMGADVSFALDIIVREARHQKADQALREETAERLRAEEEIRILNVDLEQRVIERTAQLQFEIAERQKAEEQLKASLAEKEVLLREIHHRVKNNLQVISSLVSLQSDNLMDERMRVELNDVRDRVRSMALIHEKLYQTSDLAQLNFADYATSLLHYLWRSHGTLAAKVRLNLQLAPVVLSIEAAVPCGLILNELAGNALKHGFPGDRGGEVTVELAGDSATEAVCLRVSDNGVGLPAGLDWQQSKSLGLRLVRILTGQLHGTVETGTDPGAEFRVTFPLKRLRP